MNFKSRCQRSDYQVVTQKIQNFISAKYPKQKHINKTGTITRAYLIIGTSIVLSTLLFMYNTDAIILITVLIKKITMIIMIKLSPIKSYMQPVVLDAEVYIR